MTVKQQIGVGIAGILNHDGRFDQSDLANRCCDLAIFVAGFGSFLDRFDRQDGGDGYHKAIGTECRGDRRWGLLIGSFAHMAIPSAIRCSRKAGIASRLSALSRFAKFSSSRSSRMASTMNRSRL